MLTRIGRHVLIPDEGMAWIPFACARGLRVCLKLKPDALFTSAPGFSSFLVGYFLTRVTGIPWVADYRDLWIGDHSRNLIPRVRAAVESHLERFLIYQAHTVLTVSPGYRQHLISRHPSLAPSRVLCVPNGAPITANGHDHNIQPLAGTFLHTGPLGGTRQPLEFFEAFARVAPHFRAPAPRILLAGHTELRVRVLLEQLSSRQCPDRPLFTFLGPVPHERSLALQRSALVLVLFVNRGLNTHGTIPGKLFEYIAARRPILAISDAGDAADIVRRGQLGWVIPHDAAAIAAFLEDLLSHPDRSITEAYRPDCGYLSRFDEAVMAAGVAKALEAAVRPDPTRAPQ